MYTMITNPFTDTQVDWTFDMMKGVWLRNEREHMDNNEYIWKVLMPECFIKFYMDLFEFSKEEAEGADAAATAAPPALIKQDVPPTPLIAAELILLTVVSSYLMKYGETLLGITFEPEQAGAILGGLICLAIPAGVGYRFYSLPKQSTTA